MIGDGVAHELVVVAQQLVDEDPEATFSDLLKAYFGYITGLDYDNVLDNPPDDEDIVHLHLEGFHTDGIARVLDDNIEYIKWVLLTLGFSPNKNASVEQQNIEQAHYERLVENGILG